MVPLFSMRRNTVLRYISTSVSLFRFFTIIFLYVTALLSMMVIAAYAANGAPKNR